MLMKQCMQCKVYKNYTEFNKMIVKGKSFHPLFKSAYKINNKICKECEDNHAYNQKVSSITRIEGKNGV